MDTGELYNRGIERLGNMETGSYDIKTLNIIRSLNIGVLVLLVALYSESLNNQTSLMAGVRRNISADNNNSILV